MYKRKACVLFVGSGNSCRSQMAEGWAKHLGSAWLETRSAGIEAHGLNPRAVAVMREAGVDISQQGSVMLSSQLLRWADLVVTVCDHADRHCPILPPGVQKKHWPLADPAKARGSDAETMQIFRDSRDAIRGHIEGMIGGMSMLARMDAAHD